MASGVLRGDELKSVLEQLPTVADVIAKQLNVTRDELRKMGEDGKIKLGLVASFELLRALGDPLGLWFEQETNSAQLKEFLRARNDSLYAHGLAPVDAETWRRIGARWIAWIRSAIEQTRSRA